MSFLTHHRRIPPLTPRSRPSLPLLCLALTVALLGAVAIAGLADSVREGDQHASLDPGLTATMVTFRTPGLTAAAQVFTAIGSELVISALALVLAATVAITARSWRPAAGLLAAMAGSAVLTVLLKWLVARRRPARIYEIGGPDISFSFPSGHAELHRLPRAGRRDPPAAGALGVRGSPSLCPGPG